MTAVVARRTVIAPTFPPIIKTSGVPLEVTMGGIHLQLVEKALVAVHEASGGMDEERGCPSLDMD